MFTRKIIPTLMFAGWIATAVAPILWAARPARAGVIWTVADDDQIFESGPILRKRLLQGEVYVYTLNKGVKLEIHGSASGYDRYHVHVTLNDGDTKILDAWVSYYPNRKGRLQGLQLLDADSNPTTDVTHAVYIMTIKPGVAAWEDLDNLQRPADDQAMNPQGPIAAPDPFWAPLSRSMASTTPKSRQGIKPGALWSNECTQFIDEEGNYGKYGQTLYQHIGPSAHAQLFNERIGDIQKICPRYEAFDEDAKKNFWVWFTASVIMEESNCESWLHAGGVNAGQTAAGLWQLDLGHTQDHPPKLCSAFNAYDATKNLNCGFDMLNWYTGVWEVNRSKVVYFKQSYWDTLRPGGTPQQRTNRLVQQYKPCTE